MKVLRRGQTDLWWLATEVLGFDLLTEDFHKPMMDDMDRQLYDRHIQAEMGIRQG